MGETQPGGPGGRNLRVGFIGLGSQGAPMARRIRESGYPLTVWARRAASVKPFADADVGVSPTPAELGRASDVVGICVVSDADVESVTLGPSGVLSGMTEGGTLVIHSTVHPDTCLKLAKTAEEFGVSVIDAPVSGGGVAAAEHRLLVMAGGDESEFERCRSVLETFGNPVLHLGPLGSGALAKLFNNLIFTAHLGAALEVFSSAEQLGVNPLALAEVLSHGSGGSRAQTILAATQFDLTGVRQARSLLRKDIDLFSDFARSRNVHVPTQVLQLAEATLGSLESPS